MKTRRAPGNFAAASVFANVIRFSDRVTCRGCSTGSNIRRGCARRQGSQVRQITVVKKSGAKEIIHKSKGYPLEPGDEIIVETGGGGGYGPSLNGLGNSLNVTCGTYISAEAAEREYGIEINLR